MCASMFIFVRVLRKPTAQKAFRSSAEENPENHSFAAVSQTESLIFEGMKEIQMFPISSRASSVSRARKKEINAVILAELVSASC